MYRIKLQSEYQSTLSQRSGSYNVMVEAYVDEEDLGEETVFECSLQLPGTDYKVRENILYYPGKLNYLSTLSYVIIALVALDSCCTAAACLSSAC